MHSHFTSTKRWLVESTKSAPALLDLVQMSSVKLPKTWWTQPEISWLLLMQNSMVLNYGHCQTPCSKCTPLWLTRQHTEPDQTILIQKRMVGPLRTKCFNKFLQMAIVATRFIWDSFLQVQERLFQKVLLCQRLSKVQETDIQGHNALMKNMKSQKIVYSWTLSQNWTKTFPCSS